MQVASPVISSRPNRQAGSSEFGIRRAMPKPVGSWVYGGQDETFAKREVADEVAQRLAALEAADPFGCKPVRRFR